MLYPCESCGARRFRWNDEGHPVCAVCNAVQQSYEETGLDALESGVHFSHQSLIERARVAQRRQRDAGQGPTSPRRRARLSQRQRLGVPVADQLQRPETNPVTNISVVYAAVGRATTLLTEQTAGTSALSFVSQWLGALLTDRFAAFHHYVDRSFEHGSGAVKLRIGATTLVAVVFLGVTQARADATTPALVACHSLRFLEQLEQGPLGRFRDLLIPYLHCNDQEYRLCRRRLVARARMLVARLGDPETRRHWGIDGNTTDGLVQRHSRITLDIPVVCPESLVQWLLERWSEHDEANDREAKSATREDRTRLLRQVIGWSAESELLVALDTVLAHAMLTHAGVLELPDSRIRPDRLYDGDENASGRVDRQQQDPSDAWFIESVARLRQHHESLRREVTLCWRRLPKASRAQPRIRALVDAIGHQRSVTKLWGTCPWQVTAHWRSTNPEYRDRSWPRARSLAEFVGRLFSLSPRELERCILRRARDLDLMVRELIEGTSVHCNDGCAHPSTNQP
ncbi:hypothetical protein CCYA_CCYA18G4609 [Cyanidiococcus yangmingshanensis]|nr:hypothetical protein CCYA_CCYA18G4609 [Cyanidiococcus yangmingshanensis]